MAYDLFQFLHVLTMFGAVATALISEVLLHRIARVSDVAGLRSFLNAIQSIGRLVPVLFILGAIFGVITIAVGQLDPTRPWLVGSYVAFLAAMATAALVGGGWIRGIAAAAFAGPVDRRTPELEAAVHDRRGIVSSAILLSLIALIVFLMVVKPGN
jgi:hypothetical protein